MVGHHPTNKLIGREPIPNQKKPFPPPTCAKGRISSISHSFLQLSRRKGQVTHVLLTRSPLSPNQPKRKIRVPFDLHVLSTPPAFVLSQDQTLRKKPIQKMHKSHRKQIPANHHNGGQPKQNNPHNQKAMQANGITKQNDTLLSYQATTTHLIHCPSRECLRRLRSVPDPLGHRIQIYSTLRPESNPIRVIWAAARAAYSDSQLSALRDLFRTLAASQPGSMSLSLRALGSQTLAWVNVGRMSRVRVVSELNVSAPP